MITREGKPIPLLLPGGFEVRPARTPRDFEARWWVTHQVVRGAPPEGDIDDLMSPGKGEGQRRDGDGRELDLPCEFEGSSQSDNRLLVVTARVDREDEFLAAEARDVLRKNETRLRGTTINSLQHGCPGENDRLPEEPRVQDRQVQEPTMHLLHSSFPPQAASRPHPNNNPDSSTTGLQTGRRVGCVESSTTHRFAWPSHDPRWRPGDA